MTVWVQNCSPTAINLKRGESVGELECVQGRHLEKVKVEEIFQAFNVSAAPLPPLFRWKENKTFSEI